MHEYAQGSTDDSSHRANTHLPRGQPRPPGSLGAVGEQRPLVVDGSEAFDHTLVLAFVWACVHVWVCAPCARSLHVYFMQGVCSRTCALCRVCVVMYTRVHTCM